MKTPPAAAQRSFASRRAGMQAHRWRALRPCAPSAVNVRCCRCVGLQKKLGDETASTAAPTPHLYLTPEARRRASAMVLAPACAATVRARRGAAVASACRRSWAKPRRPRPTSSLHLAPGTRHRAGAVLLRAARRRVLRSCARKSSTPNPPDWRSRSASRYVRRNLPSWYS
jgi:hypothetical protein